MLRFFHPFHQFSEYILSVLDFFYFYSLLQPHNTVIWHFSGNHTPCTDYTVISYFWTLQYCYIAPNPASFSNRHCSIREPLRFYWLVLIKPVIMIVYLDIFTEEYPPDFYQMIWIYRAIIVKEAIITNLNNRFRHFHYWKSSTPCYPLTNQKIFSIDNFIENFLNKCPKITWLPLSNDLLHILIFLCTFGINRSVYNSFK